MSSKNMFIIFIALIAFSQLHAQPIVNCGHGEIQEAVLLHVNVTRSKGRYCGSKYYPAVSPVKWSSQLEHASARHSEDMAENNYFNHDSLNGNSFIDRIEDAGYIWSTAGENISAGRKTPTEAINSWIKSPGHCANIMKKTFSEMGVACALDTNARYKYYWTMDLAKPRL